MARERADRTYRLEPLDTAGVFLGLGLGLVQCALLGTGITLAVVAVTAGVPLLVAAVPLAFATAAAFTRVGGHATWEWLPLLGGWCVTRARWGHRRTAPLPLWTEGTEAPAPTPPCPDGLDVVEIDWRPGTPLGAVWDRTRHTLTAVVPVSGPQFVVEPRAEQERLLAGWGDLLAQFAVERSAVSHLAWSDLARPACTTTSTGSTTGSAAHPMKPPTPPTGSCSTSAPPRPSATRPW